MTKSVAKNATAKASDAPAVNKATEQTRPPASAAESPVVTPPTSNSKNMDIIRVRSKAPRFRRAGIEFNRDGIDLDVSQLTAEQIDALNAEPNLVIDGGAIASDGKKAAK